ncbi:MAG: PTS sugar transporter subunit IIC/EAL domain-containing protein [Lachnospiraceae bacterium]|nr:PTS sugar transporter subunit IIC/EAL domain-containing protein [Lachnospiraceae bacterium]
MNLKEKLHGLTYNIESNFFLTIVRRGLTMMIPFILIGGIACALTNLPFVDYSSPFVQNYFGWLISILDSVYQGTFGMFSLAMVITFSLSYGMESNETVDKVAMYIMVALGAYVAQLNIGSESFDMESLGTKGSFSAIFIAILSCVLYQKIKKITLFTLRKYTMGMESVCASAVSAFIPMIFVVCIVMLINQLLYISFGVYSMHELFSKLTCSMFDNMSNSFGSGILYTFMLHLMWMLGFHGSHLLEPVAQTTFANATGDAIFSKSFFDTYVVMGGCGTTICVLLLLLIFYRKDRLGNLAKIATPTVVFNLNEVLNFGIPIILNPLMAIPFIMTPIVSYCISYIATAIGLVPQLVQEVPWSTPIIFSGYMATDSIRGAILQIVCIAVGIAIYYPFLRMHKQMQEVYAREKIKLLVNELQEKEKEKEKPRFINRADSLGLISRMLLEDLKTAIKSDKLYLLYQPQIDASGKCIGAEALLRWNHPLYGMIFPPLIIYLAKEGGVLPELEEKLFDMAGAAIKKTSEEYGEDFKISVNITAKSLLWDVESCIAASLKKHDIPAERMWIEITEQDVISNADMVIDKLKRLDAHGHTLLIDDFGMGHTSLIYLQHDFFRVVKLDGSLVKNITESKTNQKIVASVVELGRELNVEVIAEYVETEEQRDKLHSLGCHWYQGYLYSKPIPLDEFIAFIKSYNEKCQ